MDLNRLSKIRQDLHQIPELGFQEKKTQTYLLTVLKKLPQEHLKIETWRTGILVKVIGNNSKRVIGFRADMDGLPIQENTGLSYQSKHEGYMHACGHDFHMTIALGALFQLASQPIDDDVVFIFQPAEEGPGGALPMLESELFAEFRPDYIFALHISPELPVGIVSSRAGLLFANTSELFLDFKGKGGHAAYPHMTDDMVVAASTFVSQLQQIVSRRVDPIESAVVTIGKITGGTVQNVIAEHARIEGTIRTANASTINKIKTEIELFVKGFEQSHHCEISIDYGSNYYQVYNTKAYVDQFKQIIQSSGKAKWLEASAAMTGEDFGYFLRDIPGFMFWLGVDSAYGLHHSKLNPNESALEVGMHVVEQTIRELKFV
ncbi:N-acetyldiaminopimelate deacetylase [Natronobacillus azotifigens]|uniref:N-acetyldiaminopimelate deacetylase n=1 Tax=Natronobacillus azotifigens TaxID=472978 RepID=A0A9J6RF02_9BACI|nr:N-acetyldiaminopimelate deacetylase [Natronobacillus azotifigens]MCZ0703956.1 N-acetyldiaminopimelate deacetylase [Natronobacillus azotifigens]